jgi:alpha-glucosidase
LAAGNDDRHIRGKQMDLLKNQEYMLLMRPLLNKQALYSDETEMFLKPYDPDPGETLRIRFRTAKDNVDLVYLVRDNERIPMQISMSHNGFDYYEGQIVTPEEPFRYYFEIHVGALVCYFNRLGVCRDAQPMYAFSVAPGFHTPSWAQGAVLYQIYTDRFRNGDPSNDVLTDEYSYIHQHVQRIEDWNKPIEGMDVRNFYGGDLKGVMDKLDYLADLGVEAIYFNPLFVSPSNHKYDIQDYDHIDPHFGKIVSDEGNLLADWDQDNTHARRYINRVTGKANLEASNELFAEFVKQAHKRKIRVILDGVFNHCGSFNKWMDHERIYENSSDFYEKGAYIAEDSPYHNYFKFYDRSWPYNDNYDGWWGHKTLPKLNYEATDELRDEIYRIAKKWVSPPYNADGWRLDVAADLGHSKEYNHEFWKGFRKVVKEANPNAVIVAEHYGDAAEWLQGDEWDTVMNYDAFMEPISWFLTGMEKHSDSFREDLLGNDTTFVDSMRYSMAQFHMPSLQIAMNELDNHDHSRFLTRTNHYVGRIENSGKEAADNGVDRAVMREAVVFQMTWPGAPTVYYGDEAGVCGFTDPDNRRPYPWGSEDKQMLRFYRAAIALHKSYRVLRNGSVTLLHHERDVLSFARFSSTERIVVLMNNRAEQVTAELPLWVTGLSRTKNFVSLQRVFKTDEEGYSTRQKEMFAEYGVMTVTIGPKSSIVLYHTEHPKHENSAREIHNVDYRAYGGSAEQERNWARQRSRKNLQTIRK